MDTNDEWIRNRVGIMERRFADKDEQLVDLAVAAGAGHWPTRAYPSEVDTVIVPNCTMPTAHSERRRHSGRPARHPGRRGAFDLNAACAGFCYGLGVASDLIRAGSANSAGDRGREARRLWRYPTDRADGDHLRRRCGRRGGRRPTSPASARWRGAARGPRGADLHARTAQLRSSRRASRCSAGRPRRSPR